MIHATVNFSKKDKKYCKLEIGRSLYFTSIEETKDGKEEAHPYRIDLKIYYAEDNNIDQINKDMNTIYDEFSSNIHMIKEMLGYYLYHNRVISNGYDIRCISTLGDILKRYTVSVDINHALFIINGSGLSGKDTFVQIMKSNHFNTFSLSTIDPIRNVVMNELGIDVSMKTEADRLILSNIKAAIIKRDPEWSRRQVYEFEKEIKNNKLLLTQVYNPNDTSINYPKIRKIYNSVDTPQAPLYQYDSMAILNLNTLKIEQIIKKKLIEFTAQTGFTAKHSLFWIMIKF